jgi:nicotinamidase-related amidase
MRFLRDNSLLLVIDIQERLFPHMHEAENLNKNCQILLQGLKALGVPLYLSEQYVRGLGETIEPIKSLCANASRGEKRSFSCCDDSNMMKAINDSGKKQIILIGIETHVCVLQTALDLLAENYKPIVIADCVASRREADKRIALLRLRDEGVRVSTYESILFELTRSSSAEEFKTISKLVK